MDLVVHYDIPQEAESFLHRSGRTGRAGKTGTSIVMYSDREARWLGELMKQTKTTGAQAIGSPDPADIMTAGGWTGWVEAVLC